ncbi:MAG: hypothetical protein WCK35_04825 [Chloroflexota bacterium]
MIRTTAIPAAKSIRAITSTGAIVQVGVDVFQDILSREEVPIIVMCLAKSFFGSQYRYLISYKGLYFYTEAKTALQLPEKIEIINSSQMWMPNF